MTTQDKIKEVLKKVAEDLEVDTTYIEEKNVHLDRIVEITLKSCSSENEMLIKGQENLEKEKQELANKIEFLIKQYKEEITKLQETIKSLHFQNIDLLADKAEQKAKVEKLKEGIAEKCSLKTQNRLFILIDKIFSPEEQGK